MLNYHHIIIPYHHIPMLYETKTQNAGEREFTYFVSHRGGILKFEVGGYNCSRCQPYDLICASDATVG